jgi:hypothetical protein
MQFKAQLITRKQFPNLRLLVASFSLLSVWLVAASSGSAAASYSSQLWRYPYLTDVVVYMRPSIGRPNARSLCSALWLIVAVLLPACAPASSKTIGKMVRLCKLNSTLPCNPPRMPLGCISWNECSENSHIEPSQNYGSRYPEVLTTYEQVPVPVGGNFDSSEPGDTQSTLFIQAIALGMVAILVITSLIVIIRRNISMKGNTA